MGYELSCHPDVIEILRFALDDKLETNLNWVCLFL